MRRVQIIGALCLAAAACLLSAVGASAAPTDPFQYQYSFNGAGIPGGIENPKAMAVNHATGNILVYEGGSIDQYDPEGNPVNFTALGSPTLPVGVGQVNLTVDNTGGPTQGNIYLVQTDINQGYGANEFYSFTADGSPIGGGNPHETFTALFGWLQSVGVMADGSLRLFYAWFEEPVGLASVPVNELGQPVGPIERFPGASALRLTSPIFDELGNLYGMGSSGLGRYDASDHYAYAGETGLPLQDGAQGQWLAVDPSNNDVYESVGKKIVGIHHSNPLVPTTPFEALDGVSHGPIAFDRTGQTLYVAEGNRISVFKREPSAPPHVGQVGIAGIRSSRVEVHGQLRGEGAISYHFEYGTDTSYGNSTSPSQVPPSLFTSEVQDHFEGLQPNTTYHVRLVATGATGTTYGEDKTFKTYSLPTGGTDPCPNALTRKQTAAQPLLDCRAFERVSAADTGGYDVESYLAPGQSPLPSFPYAKDRLLYSTHSGAIPGPWNATNKGPDPYVATRTSTGWVTQYEGLPADINPAAGSFSSALGEADSSLSTLAFAGPGLCSPCFTGGGLETGIPVRTPSGQLVQGMSGSLAASVPASAKPEGRVAKYFSADGKKLLFASKYAFEPGANTNETDLTVYERDLNAGQTEIVSTDPAGNVLTGEGISELDVSANGSRVLVAKRVSTDPAGNEYVHPYLHIAGRAQGIDLDPGTSAGVLYAGMTADGSKVFFTTTDQLLGSDTDASADLYEADVDGSGNLSLKLLTEENSDACSPVANEAGEHWNATTGAADCSAVAISGGGGVAASTGAIYFLSPESFGGEGTLNEPNLYLATPGGSPTLVATLEPDNPLVLDSVKANGTRKTGDFQTTPSGNYAAFASALPLTGVDYFGFRNVFRYAAGSAQLLCASCDTTGTTDESLAEDVQLAPSGLSMLEDGRLFFTTRFPLVLSDANGVKDVYEWSEGNQQLISSGTGPFDSALLTASADGTDVFFFTHDALASEEDQGAGLMRIYDAREGGGFFKLPQGGACKAADECHGPGTPAPGPADIKSSGKTTQGNVITCPKNRVKKRGQCVKQKKAHAKKKHRKRQAKKKSGAKKRAAKTNGKRGGRNA